MRSLICQWLSMIWWKLRPHDDELALALQQIGVACPDGNPSRAPRLLDMASSSADLQNYPLTWRELDNIEIRSASMRRVLMEVLPVKMEHMSDIGRLAAIDVPRMLKFIRAKLPNVPRSPATPGNRAAQQRKEHQ